jgi:NAD(P)-dependent dehydrogenase (short-subunit alcohol dehydrogenase family)
MTVTLITGANKGIGFETARQLVSLGHTVYVGARDAGRGTKAAADLGAKFVSLDVTDDASVKAALATIESEEGGLDVLVNNAGVLLDGHDGATALATFDVNAVGMLRVTEAALPLLRKAEHAVVVTVSSSMGSFWAVTNPERPEYSVPAAIYAASKSAATMFTVQYAKSEPGIKFNAVEPGYTDTAMTAAMGGGRPVEDSAKVVVALATIDADGPTGTYTDESGVLPW